MSFQYEAIVWIYMATLLSKEILQQYVVAYSAFPPQFICMYFKFVFVYVDYLRNVLI